MIIYYETKWQISTCQSGNLKLGAPKWQISTCRERERERERQNIEAVVESEFNQVLGLTEGDEQHVFIGDGPPAGGGIAEALGVAEDDKQIYLVINDEQNSEDEACQPPTPPGELPSEDEIEGFQRLEAEPTTLLDRLGLIWKCYRNYGIIGNVINVIWKCYDSESHRNSYTKSHVLNFQEKPGTSMRKD